LTNATGAQALLERLRREERASWGVDPDGTAYLDVADRMEQLRAAYSARLAEEEHGVRKDEGRVSVVEVAAERR